MSQDRYGIYAAKFVYAGPTTFNLQQVNRLSVRPDAKKDIIIPGGNIDPSAVILLSSDPMVELATDDVATVLTACSVTTGLVCTGGAVFQVQKRTDGGTFASGSNHVTLTSNKGFLYPKTLTAQQDQAAELALSYACHYDGTTSGTPAVAVEPLVIASAAALTGTPTFTARYYLGPIYNDASQVEGVEKWSLDFGIEYKTKRMDGDVAPQVGSIFSRKPKFTFEILKADYASTIASLFNADPGNTLAFYLRKGAEGGARVSDASTAHVKLSAATSAWNVDGLEVQGENDATITVAVEATGTIAADLASAIP